MASKNYGQAIGIPVGSVSYAATTEEFRQESAPSSPDAGSLCDHCKQDRKRSFTNWITKLKAKANNHMQASRNNVKNKGGKLGRVFREAFSVSNNAGIAGGEKLVMATKCSLWTTAGPIAGMLFVSTVKVAFLSDCSIRLSYPDDGDGRSTVAQVPYKVVVPLARIKKTVSEHLSKPADKYLQILTIDDFELWFVGIHSHDNFFSRLQRTISEHN